MPQTRATAMSESAEAFMCALITFCRNERRRQKISQRTVAERMKANPATVTKLETFTHEPTLHTMMKYILAIPGVMDQLLGVLLEMAESTNEETGSLAASSRSHINWPRHTPSFIVNATKQMRKSRRITLDDMAERLGISRTLLGNIEGGKESPIDILLGRLYVVDYRQGDQFIGALNEIAARLRSEAIERELNSC